MPVSIGMVRLFLFHSLLFGACGYAILKGKSDARMIGLICIIAVFATLAVQGPVKTSYSSVDTGVLIVDVITFFAFTFVALISDRFWPLWVSGLQLTTILGHLVKALDSSLLPLAYAAALRFWSYPILIILAVGVWRSSRHGEEEAITSS